MILPVTEGEVPDGALLFPHVLYYIEMCIYIYIYVLPVSLPLTDRELPDVALYSAFLIQCTVI